MMALVLRPEVVPPILHLSVGNKRKIMKHCCFLGLFFDYDWKTIQSHKIDTRCDCAIKRDRQQLHIPIATIPPAKTLHFQKHDPVIPVQPKVFSGTISFQLT